MHLAAKGLKGYNCMVVGRFELRLSFANRSSYLHVQEGLGVDYIFSLFSWMLLRAESSTLAYSSPEIATRPHRPILHLTLSLSRHLVLSLFSFHTFIPRMHTFFLS